LRGRQEDLLSARERGNFLADLAARRLAPADAAHLAEELGFQRRDRTWLMPMAVALRVPAATAGQGSAGEHGVAIAGLQIPHVAEADWAPVWESLLGEMRSRAIPVLVGPRVVEGDALVLVGLSALERRRETVETVVRAIRAAVGRAFGADMTDTTVLAAGQPVAGWDELPQALRETAETAALARGAPVQLWHDATTPDVERLLARLGNNGDLRAFVEQRLRPLLDYDRRRSSKLLPTLEALLEHEGRKAETARALHVERQSLYHRIDRIESLLKADLGDADTRLGLHLAVRARRHFTGIE
jgi:PucR family transcriptional regulator, purine catabolism regulatory protein